MVARNGKIEMDLANEILTRELPKRLRALIPVPSPGRAALVNLLYEKGARGSQLNYREVDDHWVRLTSGSSSLAMKDFLIFADEESFQRFLVTTVTELYKKWNELPGAPGWPSDPCVTIDTRTEMVSYFGKVVELEPRQFQLLSFMADRYKTTGNPVTEVDIRNELETAGDLTVPISRIRGAFRETTESLEERLRADAEALVDELLPRKKDGVGYWLQRPELFIVS